MADTTSEHVMQITDKGHLKDLLKTAKALNKELEKSVDLSGGKHTPKSVAAARAASTKESGLSRSVGPSSGTGAESRDFAKQARGLGGLVHLYATFAANVFAATAALTALSKAFDTSNMVKGLDQLGAASGRNLGTLAKKMVAATDGAISLREAMESTAKASSAGLSNKQILEIGDVAKKASQALGVNMVDSVSRLTRGISKLEPELLDELGIFVRIDDAAQKYARTVGKTASSLTDFERRQAFANEVLKQGKEKFGALDIDANPYTKLYATFQDVTQKGLELVNKVLGPLVKLLSESPLALSTVLAGIAGLLLKQAIPAITSWRHNLREAAAEAAKHAKAFKDMLPEKAVNRYENLFDVPKLRAELAKLQKVRDAISAPKPVTLDSKVSSMARFKDFYTKSEEDKLKVVNSLLKERQDTLNKIASGEQKSRNTDRYIKEVEHLKASAAELTKVIDLRKRDADIAAKKAELDKAELSAANLTGGKLGWFGRLIDTEEIAARKAEKLRKSAAASMAVAAAADTASIAGIKVAWAELGKTIKDEGITGVQKFATYARGGLAAVFSRVMGLVSGLGQIGMALGAVIGVFSLLDSWLSNNSKQVERLSSALNTNKEALENVDRTITNINRKPFAEQMTVSSIIAKATAAYE